MAVRPRIFVIEIQLLFSFLFSVPASAVPAHVPTPHDALFESPGAKARAKGQGRGEKAKLSQVGTYRVFSLYFVFVL